MNEPTMKAIIRYKESNEELILANVIDKGDSLFVIKLNMEFSKDSIEYTQATPEKEEIIDTLYQEMQKFRERKTDMVDRLFS